MSAVWTHRFRSLLTILGIVIGITTVVTVASLLTGLRQGVVDFFQELGRTTFSSSEAPAIPAMPRAQFPKERQAAPAQAGVCRLHQALVPLGAGRRPGAAHSAGGGRQAASPCGFPATKPTPST